MDDEVLGKLRGTFESAWCEYVPEEDCSDGGLQPGRGNHSAGGEPVHQDVHQRPHHTCLLHRGSVLQRGHGGWTSLHEFSKVGNGQKDQLRTDFTERRRAKDGVDPGAHK